MLATGATGSPGKFSGVNTRRITFTVMLMMSVVAAMAGRLESGRYQWGTGYELSVIAAVILVGTGTHRPGQRDRLAVRVSLIRMINIGLILAGLGVSSGRSWSASSSSSRSRWRGGNDG